MLLMKNATALHGIQIKVNVAVWRLALPSTSHSRHMIKQGYCPDKTKIA